MYTRPINIGPSLPCPVASPQRGCVYNAIAMEPDTALDGGFTWPHTVSCTGR